MHITFQIFCNKNFENHGRMVVGVCLAIGGFNGYEYFCKTCICWHFLIKLLLPLNWKANKVQYEAPWHISHAAFSIVSSPEQLVVVGKLPSFIWSLKYHIIHNWSTAQNMNLAMFFPCHTYYLIVGADTRVRMSYKNEKLELRLPFGSHSRFFLCEVNKAWSGRVNCLCSVYNSQHLTKSSKAFEHFKE